MLLLLIACTGTKEGDDSATPAGLEPLPTNRACLVPVDAAPEDYTRTSYVIEVFGRVTDLGTGAPPGGCRDREEWVGAATVDWADSDLTQWVEIETADGDHWYAAATNPWVPDPALLDKQEVRVSYRSLFGSPMEGTVTETEMGFEAEGYRFYLGAAGTLDAFEPFDELTLAPGAVETEWDDDCGHHLRRSLDVSDATGTVAVPTGETHGFDGIGVWSGGLVEDVTLTCSETSLAAASVFEWQM